MEMQTVQFEEVIAKKEATIDRFRERVMQLEEQVEKMQYQASNKGNMEVMMESLDAERKRAAQLEIQLSA